MRCGVSKFFAMNKQKRKLAGLFLTQLATGGLAAILLVFGVFQGWEDFFEDLLFFPKDSPEEIVVIKIDDESLLKAGSWPWPRENLAKIISELKKSQPKVLGLDIQISQPSRFGSSDDKKLIAVLQDISFPVIFSASGEEIEFLNPKMPVIKNFKPLLRDFSRLSNVSQGHSHLIAGSNGVVRNVPIVAFTRGSVGGELVSANREISSFALEIVKKGFPLLSPGRHVSQILKINYTIPPSGFRSISAGNVLEGDFEPALFQNKIVLIGVTSPVLQDLKPTPLSRGELMPGVEIQANIVSMLLKNNLLLEPSLIFRVFSLFVAVFWVFLIFFIFQNIFKILVFSFFALILILSGTAILFSLGIVLDGFYLILTFVLSLGAAISFKLLTEEKERKFIEGLFKRYVSKEVLEHILAEPENLALGGKEAEITVLFIDIRSFTSLSEKLSPKDVVLLLNEYFKKFGGIIVRREGLLDKYIGDAIMAFWGAPLPQKNQADLAVSAAKEILEALPKLNEILKQKKLPEIKIGIGIASGRAVVGNVGWEKRFDYTAIGDTVNLASRIEGLTKTYNTSILIGESSRQKLKINYELEEIGEAEIRGREEKYRLWKFKE